LSVTSPRFFAFAEAGQFTDLVDNHRGGVLAQLTPPRQEPPEQLFAWGGHRPRNTVDEDRVLVAYERDPAEPGD
jgi:hypothetical protein